MNPKTNHEYTSNSYNGDIMGNDSPAALLDMLAEVASQTLHSEKKRSKSLLTTQCKSKPDHTKRKPQEICFTVPQLLSMSSSQLVKQFSIFTSDELKRQYSYTCALIVGCGQKYTSFASEGRARISIKEHLAEHLEYLKTNKETYTTFTAKSVNYKNHKTSSQNKKNRLQLSRKPQETLNKENNNVMMEESTNYLRNILLNDSNFKEVDKNKSFEKMDKPKKLHNLEQKDVDKMDFKVLGDHSYYERLKDENPNSKETSLSNALENAGMDENIVLMVVGTDTVHMKEYSHINQKLSEKIKQESETVYVPEIPWSTENCNKNIEIAATKPKGKAKFIGTSKEEREMALAFMDRIKKKGNPTGSNLECRICNPPRSFTAPTTLVSHYRSHAGIKPYECRICRAVFTRRHSLKYHMLIHQNQTRFTCADCGKKFRHPSHFREHRRRHTGESPFGCDDCGQRFKTRNTYKRHLKTRHGKVLTTTGELLYLSEEDFQKVRTNRKKKIDVTKEPVDEGVIATKTIMHYDNDNGQVPDATTEGYIINKDTVDDEKNYSKNTIQIIKNCFETCEVCQESQLNKTDSIETEIRNHDRACITNENSLSMEYTDKVQESLSQLQSVSYNKVAVIQEEKSELIYQNVDEPSSYIKIEYKTLINSKTGNNTGFQENFELTDNQFKDHIQVVKHNEEEFSDNVLSETVNDHSNRHVILTREDLEEDNNVSIHEKSYREKREIVMTKNLLNTYTLQPDNQIATKTSKDILLNQNDECTWREDNTVGNHQTVVTDLITSRVIAPLNNVFGKNQKLLHQAKQRICINNEPLTSIIVQNKCISIVPQFETCHDQQAKTQTQLNKNRKFTLLNKQAQTVNIKQHVNENTILLLTNNTLQNSVLRIEHNSTAGNDIKKQVYDINFIVLIL
ncbi:PREDICTED: uncharacterized protein LOC107187654 [Dufourea novaeangliae]|uniref:uncharacterized protein LOC107187654 n=1 Tax=Dufourea novaeangliae TaxID=178035 RepID=UPI0007677393|nr:PREDICTED: uncharacterized protein LOC107187654 [Dufourea novaeangliae]